MTAGLVYRIGSTLYVALTNRCNAVTLPATRGPGFAITGASGFQPLADGCEPSAQAVAEAVRTAEAELKFDEVCFAGVGEPLLRLRELESAARLIANARGQGRLRINTNGLVVGSEAADVARRLKSAGIGSASVALATADKDQYEELMKPHPLRYSPSFSLSIGHEEVVGFCTALVEAGLAVECTAVAAPGVDVEAVEKLALQLGATFRSRKYFA